MSSPRHPQKPPNPNNHAPFASKNSWQFSYAQPVKIEVVRKKSKGWMDPPGGPGSLSSWRLRGEQWYIPMVYTRQLLSLNEYFSIYRGEGGTPMRKAPPRIVAAPYPTTRDCFCSRYRLVRRESSESPCDSTRSAPRSRKAPAPHHRDTAPP